MEMDYGLYACIIVESQMLKLHARQEVLKTECEIFDRTWRKVAETRRCFIVHTQLTVMPGSMCCTGTGATMAMGFALQVQFMFRV